MNHRILQKEEIQEYVFPELENLRALLKALKFTNTLTALQFLENILEVELNQHENQNGPKKSESG